MLTLKELPLFSSWFPVDDDELPLAEAWTHGDAKLKLAAFFIA
jgi:hypothetical protein